MVSLVSAAEAIERGQNPPCTPHSESFMPSICYADFVRYCIFMVIALQVQWLNRHKQYGEVIAISVRQGWWPALYHDICTTLVIIASCAGLSRVKTCAGHRCPGNLDANATDDGQTTRNKAARFQNTLSRWSVYPQAEKLCSSCTSMVPAQPLSLT